MKQGSQQQDSKTPPTSASDAERANPRPLVSEPVKFELVKETSLRKATGPRTPQGKLRSKFNARKHGLISKAVLLEDESRAEYDALLNGLMEDFCPQGKLETVLVESLATLMWRKRRLLQAETAEIEKAQFVNIELELQNKAGELEYAHLRGNSDAKLRQSDPRNRLRDAIEILDLHRLLFAAKDSQDIEGLRRTIELMYGCQEEGPQPYSWRHMSLTLSKLVSMVEAEKHDSKDQPDVQRNVDEAICKEIMRLGKLHDAAVTVEDLKREHNLAGTSVPPQEISERLVRYEAHLSREIDRILNRLERLQRMRKGQPLPPQVDVNIS
jgi:hypothetical protein